MHAPNKGNVELFYIKMLKGGKCLLFLNTNTKYLYIYISQSFLADEKVPYKWRVRTRLRASTYKLL